jgi:hypothetical protein
MSVIPLHVRQKFEQRWAARFGSPVAPIELENPGSKATIVKAPRVALVVQGRQTGGSGCIPAFSEPSTQQGIGS